MAELGFKPREPGHRAGSFPLSPMASQRRGQVYQRYRLDKDPDFTLSQGHPSFHRTFCTGPVTVPPNLFSGASFAKKYERTYTISLLPLSNGAAKIFKAVCYDSGDTAPIQPSPTGWMTLSKSLNVSAFRFSLAEWGPCRRLCHRATMGSP